MRIEGREEEKKMERGKVTEGNDGGRKKGWREGGKRREEGREEKG